MVTKSPPPNLLSRFTELFREPGQDGEEPERMTQSHPSPAPLQSPAMRLARMQRDNAIRKQEFNELRGIIRAGNALNPVNAGALSAQLVAARETAANSRSRAVSAQGRSDRVDQWWGTADAELNANPVAPDEDQDIDLDFTGMLASAASAAEEASQPVPVQDSPTPVVGPDLRIAAMHYAEGEFAQAQAILGAMLSQPGLPDDSAEMLTSSLLEVYRCGGQQECFDALALDYAERFDRSPTEWFWVSREAALGLAPGHSQTRHSVWICPSVLDQTAWADCLACNPAGDSISRVDWRSVRHIDSSLAASFSARLKVWCEQPMQLHWLGLDALQTALQPCKTQGPAALSASWWLIQLDLLRLTQQQNAFEDMALDYCVAFEVSPPSWAPTRSTLVQGPSAPAQLAIAATPLANSLQEATVSRMAYVSCDLGGNVCGEMLPKQLQDASASADKLTVLCAQLGRIDRSAGKALLDWLINCQSKGCEVEFVRLPRLVLVHLQTLGIPRYARLSTSSH